MLLDQPQIIIWDPKLRKEAETLHSDSEFRQTIKPPLEDKKELEPETGEVHSGKWNLYLCQKLAYEYGSNLI